MTLALSRVRRNPRAKRANQNLPPLVSIAFLRARQYNPRRSQKLLQGLVGYPRGVARTPPRKLNRKIKPPLECQRSNGDSGATVEGISKGYPNCEHKVEKYPCDEAPIHPPSGRLFGPSLTDVHNEIARTQIEAPNSTLYPITRINVNDRSLEDGQEVERIDSGSSANYRRIRKQARANREASSARTLPVTP